MCTHMIGSTSARTESQRTCTNHCIKGTAELRARRGHELLRCNDPNTDLMITKIATRARARSHEKRANDHLCEYKLTHSMSCATLF